MTDGATTTIAFDASLSGPTCWPDGYRRARSSSLAQVSVSRPVSSVPGNTSAGARNQLTRQGAARSPDASARARSLSGSLVDECHCASSSIRRCSWTGRTSGMSLSTARRAFSLAGDRAKSRHCRIDDNRGRTLRSFDWGCRSVHR